MLDEELPNTEFVTCQRHGQDERPPDLRFLHFNDVYHIEYVASEHCIMPRAAEAVLIRQQSWFGGANWRDISFPNGGEPLPLTSAICRSARAFDVIFWRCF